MKFYVTPRERVLIGSDEKNLVFGSRWPVGPSWSAREACLAWIARNTMKGRRILPKLYVGVVGPK